MSLTPSMFQTIVERCVLRNFITQKFKDEIKRMEENGEKLDESSNKRLLGMLFENDLEMKIYYEDPKTIMGDFYKYYTMSQNADYLGFSNSIDYKSRPAMLESISEVSFMSKLDTYFFFLLSSEVKCKFYAKSIENRIKRELQGKYELVPQHRKHEQYPVNTTIENSRKVDVILFNTVDELFNLLSKYYNKEYDEELLRELRKFLETENKSKPIIENRDFYNKICCDHANFKTAIDAIFFQEDGGILNQKPSAVVRFFTDKNITGGCFFAKELENALDVAMMEKHKKPFPKGLFPVETEEDRKLGILRVVEWKTFENILKILKLDETDLHIIEVEADYTSRSIQIPVITPYGTYACFAKNAFENVFDQVSVGVKIFRSMTEQNVPHVFHWFENLADIFDFLRKYRYFIETWKIDEIINNAYIDLKQYSTEPIYQIPDKTYNRDKARKELYKLSPNYMEQCGFKLRCDFELKTIKKKTMLTKSVIMKKYEEIMFLSFKWVIRKFDYFEKHQCLDETDQREEMFEVMNSLKIEHVPI
ncbi:unnamed protein product [Caenorhabditis angaria]|uniref:Uncharacterized protein n=1 Tax=Caenorhabditis angaria TaxID=860376 RepID=A0A9P1MWR7_9PELO|nr:unnamed protein product [Caenorhabditis angaria]